MKISVEKGVNNSGKMNQIMKITIPFKYSFVNTVK